MHWARTDRIARRMPLVIVTMPFTVTQMKMVLPGVKSHGLRACVTACARIVRR
jgi:hypothetical protein